LGRKRRRPCYNNVFVFATNVTVTESTTSFWFVSGVIKNRNVVDDEDWKDTMSFEGNGDVKDE